MTADGLTADALTGGAGTGGGRTPCCARGCTGAGVPFGAFEAACLRAEDAMFAITPTMMKTTQMIVPTSRTRYFVGLVAPGGVSLLPFSVDAPMEPRISVSA